jgi:DNA-binding NarL/FixJ family response regulator
MEPAPRPIRVAIVDDAAPVRDLLRHRLPFEGDFVVVAEGGTGEEAIEIARRHEPDLMILDVLMPGLTGVQALPSVRTAARACKVILYSGLESLGTRNPRSIGADAFIDKAESYTRLSEVLADLFPAAVDTTTTNRTTTTTTPAARR